MILHLLKASFPLALLLSSFLLSGTAAPQTPGVDTAHTICKGDLIHPEEVIVQQWTDWFQCMGGLWNPNNRQLVAPASTTIPSEACINSPIPDGFVIIHQSLNNNACHSAGMTIQPLSTSLSSPISICANSPIPIGWITIAELGVAASDPHQIDCPLESHMSIGTKAIQLSPNAVIAVCADSYVPHGFQVDSYSTPDLQCLPDQGNSMLIEPSNGLAGPDPTI